MASRVSHSLLRASRRTIPRGFRASRFSSVAATRPRGLKKAVAGGLVLGTTITYTIAQKVEAEEKKAEGVDLKAVKKDILAIIDNLDYDDGSYGPLFVRLAWHASGTYDKTKKTGGSNGAGMRFPPESEWGANAGLGIARGLLEQVKKKHPNISYADLWVYAGVVAIETMGGPKISFRLGRVDHPDGKKFPLPDGLLPDATKGAAHLRDIFGRMGFNDQEIVALSGAHGLGRCHPDRSGFVGPWTNAPTTFSNEFFRVLLEEKWVKAKAPNGAEQYWDAKTKKLMMLSTDMVLTEDPSFRPWVEKYSKDEQLFFTHFASAFQKLTELGVPAFQKNWFQKLFCS